MAFSYCRTAPRKPQEFSQYSDDFYLNADGILCKKDIPKDDQAVVDSYFDTRLEAILDMYSDTINGMQGYNVEFTDEVVEIDQTRSKLDQLLAAQEVIDEYRASDPELARLSNDLIIKKMQSNYKAAVDAYYDKLKGVNENAAQKETVAEGKQEELHKESD